MKRREFVSAAATAGFVTGLLPRFARGADPCPPPTVSVAGGTSVSTACESPPAPGTAPDWFTSMGSGTWTTIAGNSGQRLVDKLPSVMALSGLSGESPNSIASAWTGGAVDPTRREYILCANGGHADYSGNEAYALSLGDATPAWRRICDPTPVSEMSLPLADEGGGVYLDGRPRAMHSTFEVFGDGRVWFPLLNSVSSPGGGTVNKVASFNRNALGTASTSLAYSTGMGPWTVYGAVAGLSVTSCRFGRGLFDPVNHYVYGLGGFGADYTAYWRLPTQGSSIGQAVYKEAGLSIGNFNTWAVCAYDLGIIVAGDSLRRTICVLTLANFGASNAWSVPTSVSGAGYFNKDEYGGAGGVYIKASHTIAIGDPRETGKTLYTLQIPVTSSGAYNPSGQWVWSTLNPGGATPLVSSGNSSANSKWNIVEDMGNGQAAIVFLGDISGPTYVYKVPASGL